MKAAIFDMDGTLIDSMHYWRTVALEFLSEKGLEPTGELKQEVYLHSVRVTPQMFRQHFDIAETDAQMNEYYDRRMAEHYAHDVALKPCAREYLEKLRREGVECVLATATWRELTMPLIERLGIKEFFVKDGREFIVCRDEMGMTKSSDEYYPELCRRIGAAPEECVMYEDALYSIRTAKRAGLTVWAIEDGTAALNRDDIIALADRYFVSWAELL